MGMLAKGGPAEAPPRPGPVANLPERPSYLQGTSLGSLLG